MRFQFPIILVLFISFLSACKPSFQNEIGRLESAFWLIDSIETSFYKDEVRGQLLKIESEIKQDIQLYRKHKFADTINGEEVNLLENYKAVQKNIKRNRKRYPSIEKELEYTKKQLKTLLQDVKKGNWSSDNMLLYVEQELQAVQKVSLTIADYHRLNLHSIENFGSYKMKIDALLSDIK